MISCDGRCCNEWAFGQGFDSPQLQLWRVTLGFRDDVYHLFFFTSHMLIAIIKGAGTFNESIHHRMEFIIYETELQVFLFDDCLNHIILSRL